MMRQQNCGRDGAWRRWGGGGSAAGKDACMRAIALIHASFPACMLVPPESLSLGLCLTPWAERFVVIIIKRSLPPPPLPQNLKIFHLLSSPPSSSSLCPATFLSVNGPPVRQLTPGRTPFFLHPRVPRHSFISFILQQQISV